MGLVALLVPGTMLGSLISLTLMSPLGGRCHFFQFQMGAS